MLCINHINDLVIIISFFTEHLKRIILIKQLFVFFFFNIYRNL